MSSADVLLMGGIFISLAVAAPLLGAWMAVVFDGALPRVLRPVAACEKGLYRLARIDASRNMTWQEYAGAILMFNALGIAVLWLLLTMQHLLPFPRNGIQGMDPLVALNAAVSFVTNTNWQAYAGEASASMASQMLGFGVQNFLSAATGLGVAVAVIRGIRGRDGVGLGNFWVDLVRSIVYLLLPLSVLLSLALVDQGVVQSIAAPPTAVSLTGERLAIPVGPVASQVAIKQLGSNGGGYYNANSAHPFENPTPLSNAFELFAILLIPAACPFLYGRMIGSKRDGRALFAVMALLLSGGLLASLLAETAGNPSLGGLPLLEGKELRFGTSLSSLWSVFTTATSNGSVNAMHASLSPVSALVALANMLLGEVAFGGVGAGLYGMILFVILTVFISGLLVGRTPELLGRKIEAREVRLAIIAVLLPGIVALLGAAVALGTGSGRAALSAGGPQGLSEALYAYASMANNNGSAFAGFNAAMPLHAALGALAMLLGRFGVIIPVLAIAGSLAVKRPVAASSGTFPTHGLQFVVLLMFVILTVGALTFFPALTLGPLLEHFLMLRGTVLP